jgi:hypothetical protein
VKVVRWREEDEDRTNEGGQWNEMNDKRRKIITEKLRGRK